MFTQNNSQDNAGASAGAPSSIDSANSADGTLNSVLSPSQSSVQPPVHPAQPPAQPAHPVEQQLSKKQRRALQEKLEREAREAKKAKEAQALLQWMHEQGVSPSTFSIACFDALQQGELHSRFVYAHDANPTPTLLRKLLRLESTVYQELIAHQKAVREEEAENARKLRQWYTTLVTKDEALRLLPITSAELDLWLQDGRIPVARTKDFYKWGQTNTLVLLDPEVLNGDVRKHLQAWREQDMQKLTPQGRAARQRSIDKLQAQELQLQALQAMKDKHGCTFTVDKSGKSTVTLRTQVKIPVSKAISKTQWVCPLQLSVDLPKPASQEEVDRGGAKVAEAFDKKRIKSLTADIAATVAELDAEYKGSLTSAEHESLLKVLKVRTEEGFLSYEIARGLRSCYRMPLQKVIQNVEAARARELIRLQDYPQAFPLARSLGRKILLNLGPTNSGKTHDALQALKCAASGVYLAPLRLLAMEVRDRLQAEGVPCNLLTGEEHDIVPGAQHTACTVEMMDPTREVDVAVIDEIQMLRDPQRGWAWTQALMGAPAKTVYVCGSASVYPICAKVLEYAGEEHTLQTLERKTPLEVQSALVQPRNRHKMKDPDSPKAKKHKNGLPRDPQADLLPGDAVIAFSRKDVLGLSAHYRNMGYEVATIYGALAPEVRRTEAERFARGEAEVIVATDAIGMGLNLPIRRVVFSSVEKYDGTRQRYLNPSEMQQIAGRAGRFGLHDKGYVAGMAKDGQAHIRQMLSQKLTDGGAALPIAPSPWHVRSLAQLLGTEKIATILQYFANHVTASKGAPFCTAKMSEQIDLARHVDEICNDFSLDDKLLLSCAPVTPKQDSDELTYFLECLRALAQNKRMPLFSLPDFIGNALLGHLAKAELVSKKLSVYAWLSFKFPRTFVSAHRIAPMRAEVSSYIEEQLLCQQGFEEESNRRRQRRQRRWRDDDDDFYGEGWDEDFY